LRGDLTADWREKNPDIEPASELLERIKIDRRKRWEEAELEKMKAQDKQ
jgi:type I restriction enzyme, S subunit